MAWCIGTGTILPLFETFFCLIENPGRNQLRFVFSSGDSRL
jgi:hypothetical protein